MAMTEMSCSNGTDAPPPLTEWDHHRIHRFAHEAFGLLCALEDRTMALGDVCAELRDMDCETRLLDEVIIYMLQARLIELFKEKHSDECWMRALPGPGGYAQPPHGHG